MLHLAAVFDWEIIGYDVQNAFVEGHLEEDIYMNLLKDIVTTEHNSPVKVKLNRNLYGLKQAGHVWNQKLVKDLKTIGFTQSIHDKCVFVYSDKERDVKVYCVTFVDDIIMTGNCINTIYVLGDKLSQYVLKLTQEKSLRRYIGLKIIHDRINHKIMLNQSTYIHKYLDKHKVTGKPKKTPISSNYDYTKKGDNSRPPIYEKLGSMRYSADHTRPDLLAAIGIISSGMANPLENDMHALKHIEQYLLHTSDLSLTLGGENTYVYLAFWL